MKTTTLCFLVRDGEVLLAMKKRGFGVGKWNGVGGKVQGNETIERAAVREIKEEISVDVQIGDLKQRGVLMFEFQGNPDWKQICHLFIAERWKGMPIESEEMRPVWYKKSELPFDAMWVDDPHWLPGMLAGETIDGKFIFDEIGSELLDFSV